MTSKEILSVPVVIFTMGERTEVLSKHCFESLGFQDIIIFNQQEGFSEKMRRFFELSQLEKYKDTELFIRSDADRLVFQGIVEMVRLSFKKLRARNDNLLLTEGLGHECFMKTFRGATPHIYSSGIMKHVLDNSEKLIKDVQKPESHIGIYSRDKLKCFESFEVITNLHEYEQYPSKMFHAFLNRINRGHLGYYDVDSILKDKTYGRAMTLAIRASKEKTKTTMSYSQDDLNVLPNEDKILGSIDNEDIENIRKKYQEIYNKINTSFYLQNL